MPVFLGRRRCAASRSGRALPWSLIQARRAGRAPNVTPDGILRVELRIPLFVIQAMSDSESLGFQGVVYESEDEHAAWRANCGPPGPRGAVRLLGDAAPSWPVAEPLGHRSRPDQTPPAARHPHDGDRSAPGLSPAARGHRALGGLRRWNHRPAAQRHLQRPGVGHHNLAWRGASHMSLIWLRLPLSSDGREVDLILGYDAVLTTRREVPSGVRAA